MTVHDGCELEPSLVSRKTKISYVNARGDQNFIFERKID